MERKYRILFIHPSPVPPSRDPRKNMLAHLSRFCAGEILSPCWEELDVAQGEALGSFQRHGTPSTKIPGVFGALWNFAFYVGKGLSLSRSGGRYDAIVAYGPFTTAVAGLVIGRLTGASLIIDVPGHPTRPFDLDPGRLARVKVRVARWLVPFLIRGTGAVKLLYPSQVDDLGADRVRKVRVFHDFVPVSTIGPSETDGRYLLFVGYPWYLKGVDVLIRAFIRICDEHPDVSLKVVGFCPDPAPFEELAGGHPRISLRGRGVPHEEVIDLMAGCSAFVLPSRTEAMGRVLLEAMASRKPIVASRVDGIPTYVEDGRNGLLFEVGDVDDLASKLDRVLRDRDLAGRLAEEGLRRAHRDLSEDRFVEQFRELIEAATGIPAPRDRQPSPG